MVYQAVLEPLYVYRPGLRGERIGDHNQTHVISQNVSSPWLCPWAKPFDKHMRAGWFRGSNVREGIMCWPSACKHMKGCCQKPDC